MFGHHDVDCCKTFGCKNLGILNSPDYQPQGKDILCRECGFTFPRISRHSLNVFRTAVNKEWKGLIKQCPFCGGTAFKRHGYSSQGKSRLLCRHCSRTFLFTPVSLEKENLSELGKGIAAGATLIDLRRELRLDSTALSRQFSRLARQVNSLQSQCLFQAYDIALCTRAFVLPYLGSGNLLYILVTAEADSGNVVAVSTNYSPVCVEKEYQYTHSFTERSLSGTFAHIVQRKEKLTAQRATLFDIDYGMAALRKNDAGMIVKPVLPAYRHFELVKKLTDDRSINVQHFLEHECFIYGGCLIANHDDVVRGRCHISFVAERGLVAQQQARPPRYFLAGGIRNNVWRYFSTPDYAMAVSNLTGSKKPGELCRATLLPATRFIHYVESHPFYAQMTRLSPANLTTVLDFMKYEYNQTRTVLPLEPSLCH